MGALAELRTDYQRTLCAEVLGTRANGDVSVADSSSKPSKALAREMAKRMGHPLCPSPMAGQTAGNEFTRITMGFLRQAFAHLAHVRPGDWFFAMDPSLARISGFEQYGHLAELRAFLSAHRELATALGTDYLVTPDIIIGRQPLPDSEVNAQEALVDAGTAGSRSPLRLANGGHPTLHASISCKWTMRSDRAQNTRTEALNLIRNRKGRNPHICAVTLEPLPGRIASIAMGTGDIDCTYHAALDELVGACQALGYGDSLETLETLIEGRRLRDISDLPLDLAA